MVKWLQKFCPFFVPLVAILIVTKEIHWLSDLNIARGFQQNKYILGSKFNKQTIPCQKFPFFLMTHFNVLA